MFIDSFTIDKGIAQLVPDSQDLLERVVVLVNEYSQNYINRRRGPVVRINLSRYDKKLLPLVEMLLDKRLPPKLRPFVTASVTRDKQLNTSELTIKLKESHPALILTNSEKEH